MQLNEFYKIAGGDYETVLDRLQSEKIILKFLLKFLNDQTYNNLKQAMENKDVQSAFLAAHTLKGTCANLGLDALAQSASIITEIFRDAETYPQDINTATLDENYYTAVKNIALLDT